jgi:hypothetical protein
LRLNDNPGGKLPVDKQITAGFGRKKVFRPAVLHHNNAFRCDFEN